MKTYAEEDYLQLSGIQHFAFCRRQWALIHIEDLWESNLRTVEGDLFHERAHDGDVSEKRGDIITTRGLAIASPTLGISGQCDIVEYHRDEAGIEIFGYEGKHRIYPIEYKKGEPKEGDADILQLVAQAMCLEEMYCTQITEGALFYGAPRRRTVVRITPERRRQVEEICQEIHGYYARRHTPKVKRTKACNACSLKNLCLPKLNANPSVDKYIKGFLGD